MKEARELLKTAVASNWKQQNALHVMREPDYSKPDYEINQVDLVTTNAILEKLKQTITHKEFESTDYFYLKEELFIGDVIGYKNAYIRSIELHRENPFYDDPERPIFHISFEVENPYHEKVASLEKEEEEKYFHLKDHEFNAVKDEWSALQDEKRKYDIFIHTSDYMYLHQIPQEHRNRIQEEILKLLADEDYKKYARNYIEKYNQHRQMIPNIENFTYAERLDYWDLNDELDDIHNKKTPDEKTLEQRKKRREKTEEQYNKDNQVMRDLIASMNFDFKK